MVELNKLWYKVAKSALGAVFNVHHSLTEVILGVPPLNITGRIVAVKHYLKALGKDDIHRSFIESQVQSGNSIVLSQMRDVMKFINWKAERSSSRTPTADSSLSVGNITDVQQLFSLSKKACHYTKGAIRYSVHRAYLAREYLQPDATRWVQSCPHGEHKLAPRSDSNSKGC